MATINRQQQLQAGLRAIIQPEVTAQTITWPLLTQLATPTLVQLLELHGLFMPFEQHLSFTADSLPENLLKHVPDAPLIAALNAKIELVPGNNLTTTELRYPAAETVRRPIVATLRQLGVPEGKLKLSATPKPVKATPESENYYLYAHTPITLEQHLAALADLQKALTHQNNPLLQKSLLLSAFVLTEGFLKSQLVAVIPNVAANVQGHAFQTLVVRDISQKLRSPRGRADLYHLFFEGQTLPTIPHFELRNLLAHDNAATTITKGQVTYMDEDHQLTTVPFKAIIGGLRGFAEHISH
ncbi:hypothetical protein MUDAN_DOGOELCO_00354 [Lactiplantibacillus mudanjiangensis]|uniref:hypothetical protein n=1 Tax=Lactiplantibacillus mudanjiangensis TaxID=1296538 RepID=UPI0010158823|nr:hypothetical protein [Lactiplantibacillus mudanjiangensis]VDG30853.1 hypothetical protein MUDAN_DOGOELCO_00354 [Lactiplantibacillus mudanjiangensis]